MLTPIIVMYLLFCTAFAVLTITSGDKWCCDQPANADEFVRRLVAFNNHNNDSIIDLADIQYDLDVRYDKNHDNKTSMMEFVLERSCLYGQDYMQSEAAFKQFDKNKDGFLVIGEFAQAPIGRPPVSVVAFEAGVRAQIKANGGNIIG